MVSGSIKLPDISFGSNNGSWALRVALLLMGLGLGCLLGFFTQYYYFGDSSTKWEFRQLAGVIYFAFMAIFGGAGLLAAYLIERHHKSPYANKSLEGLTK